MELTLVKTLNCRGDRDHNLAENTGSDWSTSTPCQSSASGSFFLHIFPTAASSFRSGVHSLACSSSSKIRTLMTHGA